MGFRRYENTNFPEGVSNRTSAHLFGSMGQMDPTKYHNFFDDFDAPIIVSSEMSGYNDTTAGTVVADDTIVGGAVAVASGATDTNVAIIQPVSLGFNIVAGSPVYFACKLESDEETDADVLCGLMDAVADIAPADGIFFLKADAAATVDIIVRSGASEIVTATEIHTLVVDTQTTFEFYYDGIDRVYYGVNGTSLGFVTVDTLPTGLMAPTVGVISGSTGAKTLLVDYLFTAQER